MSLWAILGTLAIVALTVGLGVYLQRRFGLLPRPEAIDPPARPALPPDAAGDTPAVAIRAGEAQLARLRTQRCRACRAVLAAEPDDHVRYDGRELLVLRFTCPACGARRSLYVAPTAAEPR